MYKAQILAHSTDASQMNLIRSFKMAEDNQKCLNLMNVFTSKKKNTAQKGISVNHENNISVKADRHYFEKKRKI